MCDGTIARRTVLRDGTIRYECQHYTHPVLLSHVGQCLAVRVIDGHARPAVLEVGYPPAPGADWVPLAPLLPQGWPEGRAAA